MDAVELLRELQLLDIRLECRGDLLHVNAPKSALTPELRALLIEHKSALMSLITTMTRVQSDLEEPGEGIDHFIGECCVIDQTATVRGSPLYSAYERWCQRNHCVSMKNRLFGMEMKKRFAKKRSNQGMLYCGIKLRVG